MLFPQGGELLFEFFLFSFPFPRFSLVRVHSVACFLDLLQQVFNLSMNGFHPCVVLAYAFFEDAYFRFVFLHTFS